MWKSTAPVREVTAGGRRHPIARSLAMWRSWGTAGCTSGSIPSCPHCRYQTPLWLTDTIRRLLDGFEAGGNTVPYFRERAMLVIDEHSEIAGRRVFDQDNKGWKAVCNALKGRAIPDDDQYNAGRIPARHAQYGKCLPHHPHGSA